MPERARQRFEEHLRLAEALGPALVHRGVLQHFFVSPVLPMGPLRQDEIGQAWSRLVEEIEGGRAPELLNLYIHIPFCAHRCRYCVYYSLGDFEPALLETYLERLHAEFDYYAPRLKGVRFVTCYLGGGTPTILDDDQLARLLDHLDASFERRPGGEWAFECNPITVSESKARIFQEHGFNRVSFGVQTLNHAVLDGVNRGYQSQERVLRTLDLMKSHNFWINVDLIHGLPGESNESMLHSLDGILALKPTQVTVYGISPYTPIELSPEQLQPIGNSLDELMPIIRKHGYHARAGTTCLGVFRDFDRSRPDTLLDIDRKRYGCSHHYDDTTIKPFSLLGIGPTARCYIYGQLRYMNDRFPVDTPFDPQAPCATGRTVTMDEERRRYVVYELEKDGLSPQAYHGLFGQELGEAFGEELEQAQALGVLGQDQGSFQLTSADPMQRFAAELLFVDPVMIDAAWRALDGDPGAEGSPGDGHRGASRDGAAHEGEGVALRVAVPALEVEVSVAAYWADRPCYHHAGDFAFFVPSTAPEGTCDLGTSKDLLLKTFARLFERVVHKRAPGDLDELIDALMAEGRRRRGLTIARAKGDGR